MNFWMKKASTYLGVAALLVAFCLGVMVFAISRKLPDVDTLTTYIPAQTTKIYSEDGIVLAELHQEENRVVIPIEQISPILQKTVIALEDTDFYSHHGINLKGMGRALVKDILHGSFVEGASTLTQQLARNLFLTKHKTMSRKVAEIVLAIQIERRYTKTEILEMYLNQVYWGHNAYGIESASQMYFGKHSKDLSLAESSILVGMLKGPEIYSPFKDFQRSKERQKVVLNRMAKLHIITPDQAREAYAEPLILAERKRSRFKAPYFTAYIVNKLVSMYGEEDTYTSGMKVYTTVDYPLQMKAADIVNQYVGSSQQNQLVNGHEYGGLNVSQAAILAIDPRTGYIRALQGGVDFTQNEFNRCVQAKRQPGSAFKPFVYLAGLEKGLSPSSIIEDTPVSFHTYSGLYSPQNYTKTFQGPVTLRRALEQSINIVAIKITNMVGPKNVVRVARELGIVSPLQPVLSLPLGANEVNMLELTSAYCVLANGGVKVETTGITRIDDRNGSPLLKHQIKEERVFDQNLIAMLVDMMRGVITNGTGKNAQLSRPVAGKTGTTSDYRDAWFVGFVPQLVCSTWVGNDDNSKMHEVTGGFIPALMWRDFMIEALKAVPPEEFPAPNGLSRRFNDDVESTPDDGTAFERPASDAAVTDNTSTEAGPDATQKLNPMKQKKEREGVIDFFNNR
ncbi:MAG: transglycosylase domain-containing protein [Candidatus Margulisiibacteriota bacterium]